MKITCEYCGTLMEDTAPACPSCGAPNGHIPRAANGIPQTIEELKDYCAKQNLPLEQMRFFIGVDYREPKAFGIYKDPNSGRCIVYKNKSDGSRAIRYEGTDEAYAVNEMYQKLKSEVANQKMHQANKMSQNPNQNRNQNQNRSQNPNQNRSQNQSMPFGNTGNVNRPRQTPNLPKKYTILIILLVFVAVFALQKCGGGVSSGGGTYTKPSYNYNSGGSSNNSWNSNDSWNSNSNDDDSWNSNSNDDDSWNSNSNDSWNSDNWDSGSDWDSDDWDSGNDWDFGGSWDSGGSDWDSDW